jgi:hypothetical protein
MAKRTFSHNLSILLGPIQAPNPRCSRGYLHGEEDQEGNHQREQSSGLSEGETQNGVREQLASEGWVPCNTGDEGTENRTDTSSGTDESSSSSSGSDELASTEDGSSDRDGLSDDAAGLVAGDVGGGVAEHGAAHDEAAVAGSRLESGDRGGWACGGRAVSFFFCRGIEVFVVDIPLVNARRAIGFNVAPLRRAERTAS